MLTRELKAGDVVETRRGEFVNVTSVYTTDSGTQVAITDNYLEQYEEFDRFVSKFIDGTFNKYMSHVGE